MTCGIGPITNRFSGSFWSTGFPCAAQCFTLLSKLRGKAWNWSGTFLFTYFTNLKPYLAGSEHWAMISSIMHLKLLFSPWSVSNVNSSAVTDLSILFEMPWVIIGFDSPFFTYILYVFTAEERVSGPVSDFAMMSFEIGWLSWAFLNLLVATFADWVLSMYVGPTKSSSRNGRAVCYTMFPFCLILDAVLDVNRPSMGPRRPCTLLDSFVFLCGWLFRFTGSGSTTAL